MSCFSFCLFNFNPVFAQTGSPASDNDKIVEMSLTEAVLLALRNNRTIKNAYLDRVVQKFNLKVAEDEFMPDIDIDADLERSRRDSVSVSGGQQTTSISETTTRGVSTTLTEIIPTGAEFLFVWRHSKSDGDADSSGSESQDDTGTSSWQVFFEQPLLRGGGIDVNMASLRTSRYREQQNILSLKSTLITTVTQTILSYRTFLQANQQVEISKASLERSMANLEVNKLLVETGRMPAVDMIQAEADLANKEFSHQQILNQLDNARLNLINQLDIDKHTQIIPTEKILIDKVEPDLKTCTDLALDNQPNYLQSLLNIQILEINLVVAQNNRLWDLSLQGNYSSTGRGGNQTSSSGFKRTDSDTDQWNMGLSLSIPFYGDLSREQRIITAKTSLRKAEISLDETKFSLEIDIKDAVRNVNSTLTQVELAAKARILSEKKLEVEQEKLNAGRTTNFQLVTFQNDLVNAQNNELNAKIAYLNALSRLDQIIGTTLDTWKIEFKSERNDIEKELQSNAR
jgi:outer membrane protein TolC